MKKEEAVSLAKKMCEVNLKLVRWNKNYFQKNFNVNGKGDYEITMRQFHILVMLHDLQIDNLSELADFLQISKSSLSLTVSKLVQEGFIRKELPSATEDGRKVYFYVTPKGIGALDNTKNQIIETLSSYYETLDEQQREDLKIGLEKLGNVYSVKED